MADFLAVAEWVGARCVRTKGPGALTRDLHVAYLEHGGEEISAAAFGRRLSMAGYGLIRTKGMSWRALRVDDGTKGAREVGAAKGGAVVGEDEVVAAYEALGTGDTSHLRRLDFRTLGRLRQLFEKELRRLIEEDDEGLAQFVEIAGSDGQVRSKLSANPRAEQLLKLAALLGLSGSEQQTTPRAKREGDVAEGLSSVLDWTRRQLDALSARG